MVMDLSLYIKNLNVVMQLMNKGKSQVDIANVSGISCKSQGKLGVRHG